MTHDLVLLANRAVRTPGPMDAWRSRQTFSNQAYVLKIQVSNMTFWQLNRRYR